VTTAGTCTVTDERNFAEPIELAMAVLGNAANTAIATWGAIAAASDHTVLLRHGTSLGWGVVPAGAIGAGAVTAGGLAAGAVIAGNIATGAITAGAYATGSIINTDIANTAVGWAQLADSAVTAAKIADGGVYAGKYAADSITITDIGAQVPGFLGRQGGSATDWYFPGTTNYSAGVNIRVQVGSKTIGVSGSAGVTFPVPFSNPPMVLLTVLDDNSGAMPTSGDPTASAVTIYRWSATNTLEGGVVMWAAIGPE
jgi:hypothetical protein